MNSENSGIESIAIVGAGLVGSLLALFLAQRGYRIDIFERRRDMRKKGESGGRSINLAISDRGWRALDIVGIKKQIEDIAIPMEGRMIHPLPNKEDQSVETAFQRYGKKGQAIYSVSRSQLNIYLIDAAEQHPKVNFYFQQKCEGVDLKNTAVHLKDEKKQQKHTHRYDLILGADGAFSAVRTSMQKTDRFNYSQSYLEHGYKELSIPPDQSKKWRIEKNALHIWPRHQFMLIALPNLDGSFTSTLFLPFEGPASFEQLPDSDKIKEFFQQQFPDALPIMPTLIKDFQQNPTSSLVTIRCYPWFRNNTAIIGDAAHAIVPFYGQGMNAGFEDCTILYELLEKYDDNWSKVLPKYQEQRKPDNDAIADLAIKNFIEMRDKVADPQFLLRKKIEKQVRSMYPQKFTPEYELVTFSHIPYAQAQKIGNIQSQWIDRIMDTDQLFEKWKEEGLQQEIKEVMESVEAPIIN